MPRYFLKMNYGNASEVEVSEQEFREASSVAGHSVCQNEGLTSFDSNSISGRIQFRKDEDKPFTNEDKHKYSPYFDQGDPEIPISGMIASIDRSGSYELDAAAVFKGNRLYLVVVVSGCSCWPDRGTTDQTVCHTKTDVDKALKGWPELISECQQNDWSVKKK